MLVESMTAYSREKFGEFSALKTTDLANIVHKKAPTPSSPNFGRQTEIKEKYK